MLRKPNPRSSALPLIRNGLFLCPNDPHGGCVMVVASLYSLCPSAVYFGVSGIPIRRGGEFYFGGFTPVLRGQLKDLRPHAAIENRLLVDRRNGRPP